MVFAKMNAVEGCLHKMLKCDGLAGGTEVAKQLTISNEAALPKFIKSAEEFFTRRKGRDADG